MRVIGGGMYGAHLALALLRDGHDVELHEIADRLFSGASGNIPARLHQGQHYPRSKLTRTACQSHYAEFMRHYGQFTRGVPVNLYCIAEHDSLMDFGTYRQVLRDEIEFVTVERPAEFGLRNVEGAILTGERHIIVDQMRDYFTEALAGHVRFGMPPGDVDSSEFDFNLDCTFCAHEGYGIDRFEACLTVLLMGPADRAVTIVDGLFPSVYPWNEDVGICSLTSAKHTPLARRATWADAKLYLDHELSMITVKNHTDMMIGQLAEFYPDIHDYRVIDHRLAIRAMPRSAADARLIDVTQVGERVLRVRAGKLDAIFAAEREIKRQMSLICKMQISAEAAD